MFLRTWGVSTPVAIKTAARFGIPADHIIGDVWASSEEDVIPAGNAAKGYLALTPYPAGTGFEISQKLKDHIIDTGKSDLRDTSAFGSVYYNSGLVDALISVEIVRQVRERLGPDFLVIYRISSVDLVEDGLTGAEITEADVRTALGAAELVD